MRPIFRNFRVRHFSIPDGRGCAHSHWEANPAQKFGREGVERADAALLAGPRREVSPCVPARARQIMKVNSGVPDGPEQRHAHSGDAAIVCTSVFARGSSMAEDRHGGASSMVRGRPGSPATIGGAALARPRGLCAVCRSAGPAHTSSTSSSGPACAVEAGEDEPAAYF